jgi:single-strand DNA-binding protein
MNKVYLIGNLTRDPEVRATASGIPVCNFSIAVNRRFRNAQTGQQETDYFNIVAWRQLADLCGRYLAKGRKVAIAGSIQTRTYEAQDGSKRAAFDIVADEVEFLSPAAVQNGAAPDGAVMPQANAPVTNAPAPTVAPNYDAPAYAPADTAYTQVDDDELPF